MKQKIMWLRRPSVLCALWTAVCFTMGSGAWLTWWYNLIPMIDPSLSDIITMVFGYVLQAAGMWISFRILQNRKGKELFFWIIGSILIFMLSVVLSLLSQSLASMLFWGLMMNFLNGPVFGFYLYAVFIYSERNTHGFLFGCGYALFTPAMYFLSLAGNGTFLSQRSALWVYLILAALSGWIAYLLFPVKEGMTSSPEETDLTSDLSGAPAGSRSESDILPKGRTQVSGQPAEVSRNMWILVFIVIFFFSVVKNLGFSFPATDIVSGTSVEFSRLFYGMGLVTAGWIHSRNPKYSAICALASLTISFVMLAMETEQILRVVFWALDYFFFGFISVYRVALPMDLAKASPKSALPLALSGLLVGRLGDAFGTLCCIGLGNYRLWLILLTLGLFLVALFFFFRLYHLLYMPQQEKERSEREVFESFAMQHDLSEREKEVLRLLISGQSNGQIAESLFVSENTIKFHVHNLLQKTGCKNRRELTDKFHLLLFPQITVKESQQKT